MDQDGRADTGWPARFLSRCDGRRRLHDKHRPRRGQSGLARPGVGPSVHARGDRDGTPTRLAATSAPPATAAALALVTRMARSMPGIRDPPSRSDQIASGRHHVLDGHLPGRCILTLPVDVDPRRMEAFMPRSRRAHVSTDDLEQALDYLDGLVVILREFDERQRGRDGADSLLRKLEDMDSQGGNWAPLRYQTGGGAGWQEVAAGVADLRRRLLEGYAEAAL